MLNILVVDDERAIRMLVQDVLECEGHAVTAVVDGTSALASLDQTRPDCVILDVMMPGISGLDVLARIRANPALLGLPVIMLTAADDDRTTWSGWSNGASYYLSKPFDPEVLLDFLDLVEYGENSTRADSDELDHLPEALRTPTPAIAWNLDLELADDLDDLDDDALRPAKVFTI